MSTVIDEPKPRPITEKNTQNNNWFFLACSCVDIASVNLLSAQPLIMLRRSKCQSGANSRLRTTTTTTTTLHLYLDAMPSTQMTLMLSRAGCNFSCMFVTFIQIRDDKTEQE